MNLHSSRTQLLFALLAGALFGAGLAISGMVNPAKVLAFLDIAGAWDPTLALVMAGALAVAVPGFRIALGRRTPWFGDTFGVPTRSDIDVRLLAGAALFGIGWGLVGLCPGPALANLVTGRPEILAFVVAMLCGMIVGKRAKIPRT